MSITLDQAVNYRSKYEITVDSKAFRNQKTNGYSLSKKLFHNIVNMLLVISIVVIAFLGAGGSSAPKAEAKFFGIDLDFCGMIAGNGSYLNGRELKVMGPAGVSKDAGTKITAWEKYGTSGTNWTVWRGPDHGKEKDKDAFTKAGDGYEEGNAYFANGACLPANEIGTALFANGVFGLSKVVVFSSNLVYQTAYEGSSYVMKPLQEQISKMITGENGSKGLKDTLYLDFLIPMIMFAALYMAWVGIVKRKSTEALHAAMWMVGSAVTGMILLSNPMIVPNTSNSIVSSVTSGIMTGVSGGAASGLGKLGNGDLCDIGPIDSKKQANNTSRLVQCSIWYSFIYVPWAGGQFGYAPDTTEKAGIDMYTQHSDKMGDHKILLNGAGTGNVGKIDKPSWAIYQLDNQVKTAGSAADNWDDWAKIPVAMLGEPSKSGGTGMVNTTWSGDGNTTLISKAFFSLIAASGAALMIIVLGMSMIIFELGLIILMMVAPLFLLIGVHPGFGRKIALKWLETIISLTMKRIMLSVLLGVMVTFYSIAIAINDPNVSWFQIVLIIVAISIAGIKYKGLLTDMFGTIDLGGGGPMQAQPGKMGGLVKGAIAGGVGAMIGSNLAGKATSSGSVIKGSATRVAPKAGNGPTTNKKTGPKPGGGKGKGTKPVAPTFTEDEKPVDTSGSTGPGNKPVAPDFGNSGFDETAGTTWSDDDDDNGQNPFDKGHTRESSKSSEETHNSRNNGSGTGNTRPADPFGKDKAPSFEKEPVAETQSPLSRPKVDSNGKPIAAPLSAKQEKIAAAASAKHRKLEDKLDKRFTKSTRTQKVSGGMKTLSGGLVKGAFMGYNGSDVSMIAMSAQSNTIQSKRNQANKTKTGIKDAQKRQQQYSKAWDELNNATNAEEKQAATARIQKTYGSMSKSEKTHIKDVSKIQKKVAKSGVVPTGDRHPTSTRRQRRDGEAPQKRVVNPNIGLPPRKPPIR